MVSSHFASKIQLVAHPVGSGSLLMMLACSLKDERSFYIKKNTVVEGSCEEHGSQANTGIARWIRGLTEGKINKLKLIKRMAYGRAGFPLLRQRVLHAL